MGLIPSTSIGSMRPTGVCCEEETRKTFVSGMDFTTSESESDESSSLQGDGF